MRAATRRAGRALCAFAVVGAVGGCGATSLGIPKGAFNIGAPPSDKSAKQYGAVDVPGKQVMFLPQGQVAMYFSDFVQGGDGNVENGEVPAMTLEVSGPTGGPPYPKIITKYGSATEVNGLVWVQINTVDVPKAGEYLVSVSGQTSGYITPQIWMGR